MKTLKQQFNDFRNSTPKYVQWLLLCAFILIVVILLTLLFGKKSNVENAIASANEQVSLQIEPNIIQFKDIEVGKTERQTVKVSVNMPVKVDSIDVSAKDISTTHDCDDLTDECLINITYKPTFVQTETKTTVVITWHIEDQPEIVNTEEIPLTYSAVSAPEKPAEEPKPVVVEEPKKEPETTPVAETNIFDDEANSNFGEEEYFAEDEDFTPVEPAPTIAKNEKPSKSISVKEEKNEEDFKLPAEKCSDFAIAAFDASGTPIGWIKPEHGAHYYHPFSDKDCSNPTGKYNTSTGVITSLKDGSRIGTDADHVGYRNVRDRNLSMPKLSSPVNSAQSTSNGDFENAEWSSSTNSMKVVSNVLKNINDDSMWKNNYDEDTFLGSGYNGGEAIVSSKPYDRTFILRQFKPIPATIVSEVRADPSVYGCNKATGQCTPNENYSIPVRATVDRNVFSDDGRTIIIPTGTLLMGYLDGELPGPYQAVGRMNIKWYQFIRPDGVEFNFKDGQDPYSADAQGRMGVPGHGSTDYIEQMVMPILTSLVPAAVNMIAPIADTVVNQIDLDNNTIVQSGTVRSSEMAKQEVISTWNKVAQKLLVDALDNTTPPFSIAAGTRINVFSPVDLIVTCESPENEGKKCAVIPAESDTRRPWKDMKSNVKIDTKDPSWIGQVRSFDLRQYCTTDSKGKITIGNNWAESGSDYRTVLMYCESQNYEAKNNVKQAVYNESVQQQAEKKYGTTTYDKSSGTFKQSGTEEQTKAYNEEVLGLTYDDDNNIINPWSKPANANELPVLEENLITCDDGSAPDFNGCCAGETYTDMGEAGFNCCPDAGGDCFPPIEM